MGSKCPICEGMMERRTVAPCYDCGHLPHELEELARGEHEYHHFSIYGQQIVLCDFCDADFGSYYPEYLGLSGKRPQEYPLELISKVVEPAQEEDGYCPACRHRAAFLTFLMNVRR